MIHGLVVAVEDRIITHLGELVPCLVKAIQQINCDDCGCRNACGLISDIANSIQSRIVPFLPQMIGALQ